MGESVSHGPIRPCAHFCDICQAFGEERPLLCEMVGSHPTHVCQRHRIASDNTDSGRNLCKPKVFRTRSEVLQWFGRPLSEATDITTEFIFNDGRYLESKTRGAHNLTTLKGGLRAWVTVKRRVTRRNDGCILEDLDDQ